MMSANGGVLEKKRLSGLGQSRVKQRKGRKEDKTRHVGREYVFLVTLRNDHCSHRGTCNCM